MASQTNNNLRIGFGLSILLLIGSSIISCICIFNLLKSSQQVRHTMEVKRTLTEVLSALKDAETGQRGYLLSGQEEYLEPYIGAYTRAKENLASVQQLTANHPSQQSYCRQLESGMNKRLEQLSALIDKKRAGAHIDHSDLKVGKLYMDSSRQVIGQMLREEDIILTQRTARLEQFATFTPGVIIGAAILAVMVAIIFYARIIRDIRAKAEMQQDLIKKDIETRQRLEAIQQIAERISAGNYEIRINDAQKDSLGSLAESLNTMAGSLAYSFNKLKDNEWLQSGMAALNEKMVGEKDLAVLTGQVIHFVTAYTGSHVGALYLLTGDNRLTLSNGYALLPEVKRTFHPGEGIVGECFLSNMPILINDIDPEYVSVSHAAGNIRPKAVIACPINFEGATIGVLELASIKQYSDLDELFIKLVSLNIGTAIAGAQNHRKLQELLEETQAQSEELQAQHSELENMNAELEAHSQKLQTSEEELRVQQEELQQSNNELEERNRIITERNLEIQKKAEELEQSTRYKSEFMANMSHELRTPLNSILLLSRYLADNVEHNLSEDQKESARVIYNSGNGLLELIDELLDLSKIEAGKMDLEYNDIHINDLIVGLKDLFNPIARERSLDLNIARDENLPERFEVDKMKLEQILKNLISNALKFTSSGSVSITASLSGKQQNFIAFAVTDTGIGIPHDKQELIFQAFTQADGSTKRKYGGTGLGLSISRQLARLMGGDVLLKSEPGKGSTFTLMLPLSKKDAGINTELEGQLLPGLSIAEQAAEKPQRPRLITDVIPDEVDDDRYSLQPGDKIILIVEDDTAFAKALLQFTHSQKYKGIVAVRGDQAIELARSFRPQAILLDIQLPVRDGWEVMEELKSDSATRHIPVHIMSSLEVKRESRRQGAVEFFSKPLATEHMREMFRKMEEVLHKDPKCVLIIEENPKHAEALAIFLQRFSVSTSIAHSVESSMAVLKEDGIDCVIMDMGIPDKTAYDALESIKQLPGMEQMPIIVFTGKSLSAAEETRIKQYADSIVVKTAHSYQRILDEVALFLHLVEEKRQGTGNLKPGMMNANEVLNGKTILVADDDVRNIFSLTRALERHNVRVITATDGAEALEQLEQHPETSLVLMDMMMPQMDGYESIARIRQHPRFKNLPVISVTAKAMLGDREKCIAAGASDYISKPVDIDQLVSLLRVWMYDHHSFTRRKV